MKHAITNTILLLTGCSEAAPDTENTPIAAQLSPEDDPSKKGHLFSTLSHDQEEDLALAINANGYLCAKVVGALPMGSRIVVECTEYRKKADKDNSYIRYMISGLEDGRQLRVYKTDELTQEGWKKVKD